MKTEPCEPCEWAGIDTAAEHYVGWDQMPLCDMHFELDKQGRLGNWINENIDFDSRNTVSTAPVRNVESGGIKMKITTEKFQNILEEMTGYEELSEDKVDAVIFGSNERYPLNYEPEPDPDSWVLTDDSLLDTLERDAWYHLELSNEGSTTAYGVVKYIIGVLENHGRDVSVLVTAFTNRYG